MFPDNLISLFIRKGISSEARKTINVIRTSEPSRRVTSGRGNSPGIYPSKKMRVTIQFESHRVELASIYEKEHDPSVYEYYDQPPSFTIRYQVDGKNRGHVYTADYFVISEDFIGWEEWKTEEELIELSIEKPHQYVRGEDGTWYMPPAEEYAASKGLSFRVRSSKDIDWIYMSNIRFLEDYLLLDSPQVDEEAKEELIQKIAARPGISVKELLDEKSRYISDDIYKLIVNDTLYFDIYKTRITETDRAKVYPNKELAEAYSYLDENTSVEPLRLQRLELRPGNKIQWDGRAFIILNDGENEVSLLAEKDNKEVGLPHDSFQYLVQQGKITGLKVSISEKKQEAFDILKDASQEDLARANEKYQKIKLIFEGYSTSEINVPDRTLRDWKAKYKKAEQLYGYGYVGLIRNGRQGNHKRRYSKEVIELIETYITDYLETVVNRKPHNVWKLLITECKAKGYDTPSFQGFLNEINKRSDYEYIRKREGEKAAYSKEPQYLELTLTTPRHGSYPFEICHLDHTQLDIELVCSKTGKNLGRPWVTFLIDAFTRRILALYLTFDEPGYRSIMMVFRECIRRHSRLPKNIIVDGGKEFSSVYFETLLAFYMVGKTSRVGKPKHGAVVERLFGTTNTMFIYNLLGNTQVMKNVRQVTRKVNPKNYAAWTFGTFLERLEEWAYEVYDAIEHPALGRTPRDEFLIGITNSGKRESTYIHFDETFMMLTMPTTKKGTAKLDSSRGIKINHIYYWSEGLLDPEFEGRQVPVRYDPFNMGVAYAYIRNTWIYMNSEYFSVFADRTEREIQQALEELKRRMRLRGQEVKLSAKKLADFLISVESEEKLLLQRLRDAEVKSSFIVLPGGRKDSTSSSSKEKNNSKTKNFKVYSNQDSYSKIRSSDRETQKSEVETPKYIDYGEF